MARERKRNELLAGLLILLAGALVVGVLLLLADWRSLWESKQKVLVIFSEQSVKGLNSGAVVLFNLEDGRRDEPLEPYQIANAAQAHVAVSRAILAQHMNQLANSDAVRDLANDRQENIANRLGFQRGRGVGVRPVITTLPEGTNFVATAVISADRRYVRVTATPLFSFIPEVSTFNFVSGEGGVIDEAADGGADGGGGGGDVVEF